MRQLGGGKPIAAERRFEARPSDEQQWMIENTWCDTCQEADLGIVEPMEFELDDKVFIEGCCKKCGAIVTSEVVEKED